MQAQCRSYSALEFDGCPACCDAALAATEQAALYVMGRAAMSQSGHTSRPIETAYSMSIRLIDEDGKTIAADEISAEQTISTILAEDAPDDAPQRDGEFDDRESSMRLDDFQTVLDRLEIGPDPRGGTRGIIAGRLYGFERSIGRFEVEVLPAG